MAETEGTVVTQDPSNGLCSSSSSDSEDGEGSDEGGLQEDDDDDDQIEYGDGRVVSSRPAKQVREVLKEGKEDDDADQLLGCHCCLT